MDSHTFNSLVSSLQEASFDDEMADTIKTTVRAAKRISASQMVQLLDFLSFDDKKLEVAKMGYQYTTDPHSYGATVGAVFSFSDMKEKLNAHIRQNPHRPPPPSPPKQTVNIHYHFHE